MSTKRKKVVTAEKSPTPSSSALAKPDAPENTTPDFAADAIAGQTATLIADKIAELLAGKVADLLADRVADLLAARNADTASLLKGMNTFSVTSKKMGCTLYTKELVRQAIYPAISAKYKKQVHDEIKIKEPSGLGLDDIEIRTGLFSVVRNAVESKGCILRTFNSDAIASCGKCIDIVNKVWADLTAPA